MMHAVVAVLAAVAVAATTAVPVHDGAANPALTYKTYTSPPVHLRSGQIANTPGDFGPLEFPPYPISVKHFHADVVDGDGNLVPLSELYVHHWLIYNLSSPTFGNTGFCPNLSNIWGIGAELYHTEYNYPGKYGIITTGTERWGANLHFIRTTNVPDIQACIECRCPDSTPEHPHGGVSCCPDESMCWGMHNSTIQDTKPYFLQYTIGFVNATADQIPLQVFSLDVTSTELSDCQIQYDIPAVKPGEFNVLQNNNTIPQDIDVVYMESHVHIGGQGISVEHFRDGAYLGVVCNSTPVYGTGNEPGNESAYLVDIPTCNFADPYSIKAGDVLQITSVYNGQTIPGGHNYHEGVMGLVYMAGVATKTKEEECLEALHIYCGPPPYPSETTCIACAKNNEQALGAYCNVSQVEAECSKTYSGGNVPAPAEVTNMTLHVVKQKSSGHLIVDLSGPVTGWFAIAVNANELMDNATAWIVNYNTTYNFPYMQEMLLGNHKLGAMIDPDFPATSYSTAGNIFNAKFVVTDTPNFPDGKYCYLFAQGKTHDLVYHGAARGVTCVTVDEE